MIVATVLVPTHDHGATLRLSVGSALAQTVEALEVFVVGDGMPPAAQAAAEEVAASDPRVRLFVNPKGPRHGEDHRHRALAEARGRIVCYLADDDLWLPEHVETLDRALGEADFAHALPIRCFPGGDVDAWTVDLSLPHFRDFLLRHHNRVPLSCGGHTLSLYRKLPQGWSAAPPDLPTDLNMWRKLLSHPDCRAASTMAPTVIHLASPDRRGWSLEERVRELEAWRDRTRELEFRPWLWRRIARSLVGESGRLEMENLQIREILRHLEARHRDAADELERLGSACGEARADAEASRERTAALDRELAEEREERRSVHEMLARMSSTATWRLRERLIRVPLLGPLARWAARGAAHRAGD